MGSRGRREPAVLVEVTPSRWDEDPMARSRALLTGLAGTGGVSLEYAASGDGLRFYLRAASADAMRKAIAQLRPAYPQASLIEVAIEDRPHLDPAWRAHGEEMAALELRLSRGADLPLTCDWRNRGDPLRAALAAASTLRDGERIVCQLVLAPAPPGWADGLRSRSQRRPARGSQGRDAPPTQEILPFLALFGIGAVGLQGYRWYQAGDILPLVGTGAAGLLGLPLAAALVARFMSGRQPLDQDVIEQKLAYPAFAAHLRILTFGPPGVSKRRLSELAASTAAAYQAYDHPAGNGLRPRPWRGDPTRPTVRGHFLRRLDVLNAAEIDGLMEPSAAQLEVLHEQSVTLARLVEDLRTLSLASAGHLELRRQPVDVGELARDIVSEMETAASHENAPANRARAARCGCLPNVPAGCGARSGCQGFSFRA